jgi:hypothetical protein
MKMDWLVTNRFDFVFSGFVHGMDWLVTNRFDFVFSGFVHGIGGICFLRTIYASAVNLQCGVTGWIPRHPDSGAPKSPKPMARATKSSKPIARTQTPASTAARAICVY